METRPDESAPGHAPVSRELVRSSGVTVLQVLCRAGPGDRPYDEEHTDSSIVLVKRGVFTYRSGGRPAVLGPGWVMLGNAGEPYVCSHEHATCHGDDCLALQLSAGSVELIRGALGRLGGRGRSVFGLPNLPPMPRVIALLRLLEDGACGRGQDLDPSEVAFAVAARVLADIAAQGAAGRPLPAPSGRASDRRRAREAVRIIEQRATEPLSLDVIAGAIGLSPFHFLRLFRQELGVTPHQYLIRARLRRAIMLLRDTALPVTEVAFESGYADLSNFVRTFHREVGCSPRDFRRGNDRKILQEPAV